MSGVEFRISWKRPGKARRRRCYQTREGADGMLDRLESGHFEEAPKLEERPVGPWRPAEG